MEVLIPILNAIATSAPVIIVWMIGIALALSRWRRHPRVSLFVLIAFAVSIVNLVVNRFLIIWLPLKIRDYGLTANQTGSIFFAVTIIAALVSAVAWALVLCAIFGWRDSREKQDLFPPAPPTFGNKPREQNATP
jgi:hypothetical protein